jgi:hypothetical protein
LVISGSRLYNKNDILPEIAKISAKKKRILSGGRRKQRIILLCKKQLEHYGIKNTHFLGALKEEYYDI